MPVSDSEDDYKASQTIEVPASLTQKDKETSEGWSLCRPPEMWSKWVTLTQCLLKSVLKAIKLYWQTLMLKMRLKDGSSYEWLEIKKEE